MSRRTTCEGVMSSSAHRRSKKAFLRGSMRIVRRAVRSSRVTVILLRMRQGESYSIIIEHISEYHPAEMPFVDSSLSACLVLIALWGLIGLAGLLRPTSLRFVGRTLFPLGAICGVALAVVAATSLGAPAEQAVLPLGLPDLPFHVRRDALS